MSSEPKKIIPIRSESTPADDGRGTTVTMTKAELREIVRQEVGASFPTELVDAETIAKKLSIPVSWVYEQSRQGKIPTHRVGIFFRFNVVEVLESQKKKES